MYAAEYWENSIYVDSDMYFKDGGFCWQLNLWGKIN